MSRNQSDHYTYPPTGEDQTRVTSILDGTEGKQRYLVPWSGRVTSESNVDHLDQIAELLKSEGRQAAVDFAKDTAEQETRPQGRCGQSCPRHGGTADPVAGVA